MSWTVWRARKLSRSRAEHPETGRLPNVVGIADVAARAGVSTMSVSRVLNDSPLVTEATRERVLRAIADLGYMPSAPARSLARGRTQLLGVLIPSTNNPIYGLYVDGIRDAARPAGYSVVLSKPTGDVDSAKEADVRLLSEQRAAGVIITPDAPLLLAYLCTSRWAAGRGFFGASPVRAARQTCRLPRRSYRRSCAPRWMCRTSTASVFTV